MNLAIHAGEVEEPNHHVRDALLLMRKGAYRVEINLSWNEMVQPGRNSLRFAFVDAPAKARLLAAVQPETYGFMCQRYRLGCRTR